MNFRWRVWTERMKSLFLIILVVSSLVLSGLIWLGTPNELAVGHPNFYSSPMYGSERSVNEFIRPSAVWLWTGNKELFRVNGTSQVVQKMMASLRQAEFVSGRLVPRSSKLAAIPPKLPYLLFDFNGLLSDASLWPLALPVPQLPVASPTRQLVALVPLGKGRQYKMIFPSGKQAYVGDLELPSGFARWLKPSDEAIPYALIPKDGQEYRLPYASLKMPVYRWILYHPVATHVIDSFFLDPSLIQPIQKTSTSTLYSDGTQSVELRVGAFGNDLTFSCPSGFLLGYRQTANLALQVAVPFMDSHGGFVGDQVLSKLQGTSEQTDLVFQDVIDGWPLFSLLDQIRVRVQNGMVTGLWHSLSYPGVEMNEPRVSILSGTQLLAKLNANMTKDLNEIALGYGSKLVNSQTVDLVPVYRLRYRHGVYRYLDAQTGQIFSGTGM